MTHRPDDLHEVWEHSTNGASLCALINGSVGWLMFLRDDGDAGFSSRNPDYAGDPTATISYRMVNGQEDSYPASWALPIATVESALQHFRATGERPPFVVWHDDSL